MEIELQCANCGKAFSKKNNEYKRQIKKGNDRFFCSLSCVCIKRNEENPPQGNIENIGGKTKRDEYTPFRWFKLRAQYRDKKKKYGCDLTLPFLKSLWEVQNGTCPITGWKLKLPSDCDGWETSDPSNASLDRIDNSRGYVEGNVRFVAVMANLARQCFTDKQLIDFCKAVAGK